MWVRDITNRLLDGGNLVGLCVQIHARTAISSKTLQSGGELPVRRDTGSTGPMNPGNFTFHTKKNEMMIMTQSEMKQNATAGDSEQGMVIERRFTQVG